MKEIYQLAEELKVLKELKKDLEEEGKELSERINFIENQLSQLMIMEEIGSFDSLGMTFYLNPKIYTSQIPGKREELLKTLRTQGHDHLIHETVNGNSLGAFARKEMEKNNSNLPRWLEGLVNFSEKITIGMKKVR